MNAVAVTIHLPEDVAETAREQGLLEDATLTKLIQDEIARRKEEDLAWEASFADEDFDAAFSEDGAVDFGKLRALGKVMTLDDFQAS